MPRRAVPLPCIVEVAVRPALATAEQHDAVATLVVRDVAHGSRLRPAVREPPPFGPVPAPRVGLEARAVEATKQNHHAALAVVRDAGTVTSRRPSYRDLRPLPAVVLPRVAERRRWLTTGRDRSPTEQHSLPSLLVERHDHRPTRRRTRHRNLSPARAIIFPRAAIGLPAARGTSERHEPIAT